MSHQKINIPSATKCTDPPSTGVLPTSCPQKTKVSKKSKNGSKKESKPVYNKVNWESQSDEEETEKNKTPMKKKISTLLKEIPMAAQVNGLTHKQLVQAKRIQKAKALAQQCKDEAGWLHRSNKTTLKDHLMTTKPTALPSGEHSTSPLPQMMTSTPLRRSAKRMHASNSENIMAPPVKLQRLTNCDSQCSSPYCVHKYNNKRKQAGIKRRRAKLMGKQKSK